MKSAMIASGGGTTTRQKRTSDAKVPAGREWTGPQGRRWGQASASMDFVRGKRTALGTATVPECSRLGLKSHGRTCSAAPRFGDALDPRPDRSRRLWPPLLSSVSPLGVGPIEVGCSQFDRLAKAGRWCFCKPTARPPSRASGLVPEVRRTETSAAHTPSSCRFADSVGHMGSTKAHGKRPAGS